MHLTWASCEDQTVTVVNLGSSSEYLSLSSDDAAAGPPQTLVAELRVDNLSATHAVVNHYATGFTDLANFFAAMATDWRGWEGVRAWRSLEDELRIEAQQVCAKRCNTRATIPTGHRHADDGMPVTRTSSGSSSGAVLLGTRPTTGSASLRR